MAGLHFEEFAEGQVFEHAMTRTVTEMDNVLFTTLTMNPQPLHLDAEFAKTTVLLPARYQVPATTNGAPSASSATLTTARWSAYA